MQQTKNRATDIFRLNFSFPGTKFLGVMSIICIAVQGQTFPRGKVPGLC